MYIFLPRQARVIHVSSGVDCFMLTNFIQGMLEKVCRKKHVAPFKYSCKRKNIRPLWIDLSRSDVNSWLCHFSGCGPILFIAPRERSSMLTCIERNAFNDDNVACRYHFVQWQTGKSISYEYFNRIWKQTKPLLHVHNYMANLHWECYASCT